MKRNEYKMTFDRWEYIERCQKGFMKTLARRITRRKLKNKIKQDLAA